MLEEIKELLYEQNEYGYSYQNSEVELPEELVEELAAEYGIRTDVHRTCINCQLRQLVKYGENKIKCNFIAKGLPKGSMTKAKEIATQSDIPLKRAIQILLSTIDPVAWAELMFGFDDSDQDWKIRSYQKEQLRCTASRTVIREGRRSGKALPLDTPIPTPSGWTTMGDIGVGDKVFGPDGKPTKVTFVTETMYDHVLYKIVFDDGSSIVADADHQWTVSSRSSRRRYKQGRIESELYTCTTQDLVNGRINVGKKKPEFNYRIELSSPVDYEYKELPIEPYLFGFWLGDGVRNTGRITIGLEDQNEICDKFRALGYEVRQGGADPIDCNIYGLVSLLKKLGVCNNKHIPREYLQASIQQRWELLQGLMDSDGSVDQQGHSSYCTTDTELADNFYELACSLGLKVTRTIGESWLNGQRHKDRHRFYFNTNEQVFKLARKQQRVDAAIPIRAPRNYRAIVRIETAPSVPVRCITVDNSRHLYLAGKQFLVTHNTFAMALKILYYVFNLRLNKGRDSSGKDIKSGPNIMIVTPYQAQVSNIFAEIESLLKRNEELSSFCTTNSAGSLYVKTPFFRMEFEFADGSKAKISGFVSGTGIKQDGSGGGVMRGQSADIVYLDEMDMIPEEVLEAVVTPILLTRPDTIMLATSTPIGEKGKFFEWCTVRPEYKEDYYPSTVLPHWDQIKEELEAESTKDGFTAEYMASFPDNTDGVFKMSWIKNARLEYDYDQMIDPMYLRKVTGVRDPDNMIKSIGIDWNKNAGTEFYVLGYSASKGCWVTLEAVNVSASEYSAKRWAEEVIRLNYKWKPNHIYADEGYGHTIIEDLKLLSYKTRSKKNKSPMDRETALIADRLVSFNFSRNIELKSPIDGQTIVKSGKHYLVENMVRAMEDNKFFYALSDESLTKQFQNYTILRRHPSTGKAVYGMEKKSIGDHRLDAAMLALAALTLEESVYAKGKIPYSEAGLVTRRPTDTPSWLSPHEETNRSLAALQKAGLPGALDVLKIVRGNGSDEEDRMIKEKYKRQGLWKTETSNNKRRGDILGNSSNNSAPSILGSINSQTNQFSAPQRSGPRRSKRGSRSWKK